MSPQQTQPFLWPASRWLLPSRWPQILRCFCAVSCALLRHRLRQPSPLLGASELCPRGGRGHLSRLTGQCNWGAITYDWAGCNMLQRILCWDKAGHSSKSRGVIESQFTLDNDDSHFAWLYVSLIYIYIHNYTHITYVTYVQYIPVYPPNFLLRYISKLVVFLDPSCSVVPHLQSSTAGAVSSPMWSFTLTSAIYLHRYK